MGIDFFFCSFNIKTCQFSTNIAPIFRFIFIFIFFPCRIYCPTEKASLSKRHSTSLYQGGETAHPWFSDLPSFDLVWPSWLSSRLCSILPDQRFYRLQSNPLCPPCSKYQCAIPPTWPPPRPSSWYALRVGNQRAFAYQILGWWPFKRDSLSAIVSRCSQGSCGIISRLACRALTGRFIAPFRCRRPPHYRSLPESPREDPGHSRSHPGRLLR